MFAQGKAGQVQSCGNGRLSLSFDLEEPHPRFSTWASVVSEATSLLADWLCHPFLGPGPQRGVDRTI